MQRPLRFDSRVVVATHHKAGTRYSRQIFSEICDEFGWKLRAMQTRVQPPDWQVAYHEDATPERLAAVLGGRSKLIHFVRHPKSLIVSGARYHLDADEAWLDRPRPGLGGRTYREALCSQGSVEDRIRFEMRRKARESIEDMVALERAELNVPRMTVKLEEVSWDTSGRVYEEFLTFLGFTGAALDRAVEICVRHALWSLGELPSHSRGGVDLSWRNLFTPELDEEYRDLFGDAEEILGYRLPPFPTVGVA